MNVTRDEQIQAFRGRSQIRYLDRKLRTYAVWAHELPLRTREISPEDLYAEWWKRLMELREADEREGNDAGAIRMQQRQQQQRRPEMPWNWRDIFTIFDRLPATSPPCTMFLGGVDGEVRVRSLKGRLILADHKRADRTAAGGNEGPEGRAGQ